MKQIDDAASFITNILMEIFRGDYSDTPKVRLYCHYAESILISLLNAKRLMLLEGDCFTTLDKMAKLGLLSADVPLFYCENGKYIKDAPEFDIDSDWCNAHLIHEGLLGRELNISEKNIWFSVDKLVG